MKIKTLGTQNLQTPMALATVLLLFDIGSLVSANDDSKQKVRKSPEAEKSIYAKVILPFTGPAESKKSKVEKWIKTKLQQRRVKEFQAVTSWIRISNNEETPTVVWDSILDGKALGCPVSGVVKPTKDGKLRVELGGWSPVGAEVSGNIILSEIGNRTIAVVDAERIDGVKYYVAIFVAPPAGER